MSWWSLERRRFMYGVTGTRRPNAQRNIWELGRHYTNTPRAFFLIKPTDALISQIYFVKKLYMFRAVPLPIIRSFTLYIRHWYMSCRFHDNFQERPSWMVVFESCHQTCMTYTSAECTVENSWWWTEELPETCRVSWQNKFGKLVRLLVLLKRNLLRCTVTWT